MGLDISAVTKYKIHELNASSRGKLDCAGFFGVHQPKTFEKHLSGDIKEGVICEIIEQADSEYSNGYAGHSVFRNELAWVAGYKGKTTPKPNYLDPEFERKSYEHNFPYVAGMYEVEDLTLEMPFVAIIHFSDCEGIIGNKLCRVLSKDFSKYRDSAKEKLDEWSFKKYEELALCVQSAAVSGGFLRFW